MLITIPAMCLKTPQGKLNKLLYVMAAELGLHFLSPLSPFTSL